VTKKTAKGLHLDWDHVVELQGLVALVYWVSDALPVAASTSARFSSLHPFGISNTSKHARKAPVTTVEMLPAGNHPYSNNNSNKINKKFERRNGVNEGSGLQLRKKTHCDASYRNPRQTYG
jgi:hypothetical protein